MAKKSTVVALVAVGILVAAGGIVAFVLAIKGAITNEVHGTVTAHGKQVGNWTMTPDVCVSGERNQFHGAQFFVDGNDVLGISFIQPIGQDPALTVNLPGKHQAARFGPADCKTLSGHVERQNSMVNRITNVRGSVTFDCGAADDRVSGELTFSNCH